ncbi:ABC transporter permease OS=Streptomyces alboniger OX=132473 GN=CP975_16475 PE=4 SV=1 [Streptomyces alboniger]
MSASTAPAAGTPRRTVLALPGPYRAVLRRHRSALWIAVGMFALAAAALTADRLWIAHAADVFAAADCSIRRTTAECGGPVRGYLDAELQFGRNLDHMGMGMLALPCLIGAFVAGPLVARDLETGTYKLAWTQSLTPARWLADRLTLCAAVVTTGVVLLVAVQRWAWSTGPGLEYSRAPWYERAMYGSIGPVALGYALLGLAVGALAGIVLRRTLPAVAAAATVTAGAVIALPLVRHRLWPTETVTWSTAGPIGAPHSGYPVERGMLSSDGDRLPESLCWVADPKRCLADHQVTAAYADFHPASHFWPLQLVETAVVLALAAAALYAAFRVLRRRTA